MFPLLLLALMVAVPCRPAAAGPAAPARSGRFYEPVEVPGSLLPGFLGRGVHELALYAWEGSGVWRPVLLQIDECTPDGDFVFSRGPEANAGLANGVLDGQDLLVFMAREAAGMAPETELPPGATAVVPVELVDPLTSASTWVYLARFEGKAPATGLEPVSSLSDTGAAFRFRFPTYCYDALTIDPDGKASPTIYIDQLRVSRKAGGSGENIMDRQKTRGMMSFMGGLFKVRFNESIVRGGVVAWQPGPVRVLTHSTMFPRLRSGIKGPKFYLDSILVDSLTLTRITMNVPFDPGFLMHRMTLAFGTDLSPAAKGMRFHNSANPAGLLIDGSMDPREKAFETRKDDWRLITGPQGTQITCTWYDPGFLTRGSVITTYLDDESARHPPENFPGDLGAVFDELTLSGLPAGSYWIEVLGCVPRDFHDPAGLDLEHLRQILNVREEPLVIRAGGQEIRNQGGRPRVLLEPRRRKP